MPLFPQKLLIESRVFIHDLGHDGNEIESLCYPASSTQDKNSIPHSYQS